MGKSGFIAFFSYAHVDHEADPQIVDGLVSALEAQTRAAEGSRAFTIWRDVGRIRWGEEWRPKIHSEIGACDFFIILLSPGWLKSDVCREEYDAFLEREEALGGGERIFVAQIRPISKNDPEITREMWGVHAQLRERQGKAWRSLLDATAETRATEFRKAGEEIAARIIALRASPSGGGGAASGGARPAGTPADAQTFPLVSGNYYIPRPDQSEARPGALSAHLKVAFLGLAKVTVETGTVVFTVRSALLSTTVTGGRIVNARPDFETRWAGPLADVVSGSTNRQSQMLRIEARPGEGLAGNVLAGRGEDGHVRLFDVEPEGGAEVRVEGDVTIDVDGVHVERAPDGDGCLPQDDPAWRGMVLKLVAIAIRRKGQRGFRLEGDERAWAP